MVRGMGPPPDEPIEKFPATVPQDRLSLFIEYLREEEDKLFPAAIRAKLEVAKTNALNRVTCDNRKQRVYE